MLVCYRRKKAAEETDPSNIYQAGSDSSRDTPRESHRVMVKGKGNKDSASDEPVKKKGAKDDGPAKRRASVKESGDGEKKGKGAAAKAKRPARDEEDEDEKPVKKPPARP